jgi:hypothetical protein
MATLSDFYPQSWRRTVDCERTTTTRQSAE